MSSIKTLLETMRMLRDKDNGCPWDIEQTFESLSLALSKKHMRFQMPSLTKIMKILKRSLEMFYFKLYFRQR
jgi:hypothetical protein